MERAIDMFRLLQRLRGTHKKDRTGDGELFIFLQTKEQMDIARRHGAVIFLDATYRTNVYGFPVFFLAVLDPNGHGRIVTTFITQFEDVFSIERCLSKFKEVNPSVIPRTFMIDFSELEIDAIARVYPDVSPLIC